VKLAKRTQLEKVMQVLNANDVQYARMNVTAQDKVTGEQLDTIVLMFGGVFKKSTGEYMFACPVSNPLPRNGAV
jgi:hypothetical protein